MGVLHVTPSAEQPPVTPCLAFSADSLRWSKLNWFVLALASLFPVWCGVGQGFNLNDDAYITLTYAKNLAAGRGFVFNHPPATFGTTTPLLALVVAALGALLRGVSVEAVAVWVTVLAWIAAGWSFYGFRRAWGLSDESALLVALAVLFGGWSGPMGVLGSEVFLFHALLVLTFSLHLAGYGVASGVAAGLLFLTRGEGVLALGVIGLSAGAQWLVTPLGEADASGGAPKPAWRQVVTTLASSLLRPVVGFGIVVGLWAVYAYGTFGHVLPATLSAKRIQVALGWPTFTHELATKWWRNWGGPALGHPLLSVWWALVAVGISAAIWSRRRWLVFLLWLIGYVGGYAALGVAGYWWYQTPVFLSLHLFFALGLVAVVERLAVWRNGQLHLIGRAVTVCGLACAMWPAAKAVTTYHGDWRASSYRALAAWFHAHAHPTDRVAFHEVGYLGFYSEQRIVDLCGLTTPEVLPHFARRDLTWPLRTLLPEWYVASPTWDILPALREGGWLDQHYHQVATLPAPGGGDLRVFQRIRRDANVTP
ncbi:hypothetical protein J8C06_04425 [Chloracidobacterium validum]|uniref:Glycosyltransferase RgtA/B/C/D-like domain-containing protein n=1 Tax=Chloracidobacterium validum TaxID=2821543 RepID=A0ABX8B9S4_9BACT|nr:hypothetical protein [Chloracidobacterium validum]QUW03684.1 hypothetical protein J8C06_04425 [Chloracidobacterium validum]